HPDYPLDVVYRDDELGTESEDLSGERVPTLLRGAKLQVPLAGLERIGLAVTEGASELRLGYRTADVTVVDRTGSRAAAATLAKLLDRYRDLSVYVTQEAWERVRARARAVGAERATEARLQDYRSRLAGYDDRFRRDFSTLGDLREAVLRASPADPPRTRKLYRVYRHSRLLRLKPDVVASAGPGGEAGLVVCGPVVGVRRGRVDRDPEVHAFVDGPDGIWLDYHLVSRPRSAPLSLQPALVDGFFFVRPYAMRGGPPAGPGGRGRKRPEPRALPTGTDPVRAALRAVGEFHLAPSTGSAHRLVQALRRLERRPSPDELTALARQLAGRVGAGEKETDRLLRSARD
ncbi:MAG: hypothetical protein ACYSUM_17585, partial [Planctomycetota bacterium]